MTWPGGGGGARSVCQTARERNEQVGKTRRSEWVEKEESALIAVKGQKGKVRKSSRVEEFRQWKKAGNCEF